MSYLRLLMPSSRRRRLRQSCERCRKTIFRFEAYCPYCGHPNVSFDEGEFERLALTTSAAVCTDCSVDPSHTTEQNAAMELRDPEIAWCTICGAKLANRPLIDES